MTTGEKIQFYRRKLGLSQEELAKRMLLSRQTISLWEMDKTVPTLENLIRLKEILEVSLDDLLCEDRLSNDIDNEIIVEGENDKGDADESSKIFPMPDEQSMIPDNVHIFRYDKKELKRIFKKLCAPMWRLFILFTVIFAVSLVMTFGTEGDDTFFFFVSGMAFVYFVCFIKWYISYRKAWNKSSKLMIQSVYSYQVFDGYFVLNIFRDGDAKKWLKIGFDEIEAVRSIDEHFVLTIAGQIYIIRKHALPENSPLLAYCNCFNKKKSVNKKHSRKITAVSIVLFVLTLLSILFPLILMAILTPAHPTSMGTEFMWVFFCFTPITLASAIFGFCFRKKKNIIAGIIMTVLLCAYGSFVLIPDAYLHTDEPIVRAEQELNIDIPEHRNIDTMLYEDFGEDPEARIILNSVSDIYFDSESDSTIAFTENISQDTRWIREIPNDMLGILHYSYEYDTDCYHLIYNKTTKEFNTVPSENGKYEFIHIIYGISGSWMQINEYQVNYLK